jgi:hypothetical protein
MALVKAEPSDGSGSQWKTHCTYKKTDSDAPSVSARCACTELQSIQRWKRTQSIFRGTKVAASAIASMERGVLTLRQSRKCQFAGHPRSGFSDLGHHRGNPETHSAGAPSFPRSLRKRWENTSLNHPASGLILQDRENSEHCAPSVLMETRTKTKQFAVKF